MHAAKLLSEADFKVVGISDVSGGYFRPGGLDIDDCIHYSLNNRYSLEGYANAEQITNEQLLAMDVQVLIPAALGGVIHRDNVGEIKADIIVEAANAPIRPDADKILHDRGTVVLPDILANAGGVTASYFEWVQNRQHYRWSLDRVRQELDSLLMRAFDNVWDESREHEVSLRVAAS